MPVAIRLHVASANGVFRSNMLGQGIDQSIHSAAVRQGFNLPDLTASDSGSACVCVGHLIGIPSRRAIRKKRLRIVGEPKSQARNSLQSTVYPWRFRALTKQLNVRPFFLGHGRPSSPMLPHVLNSSTFSSMMTRGRVFEAHRSATHAKPRIFFSTGLPPFALEKCLQSGDNHTKPNSNFK